MKEPDGLQSMGSQRVRHDLVTKQQQHIFEYIELNKMYYLHLQAFDLCVNEVTLNAFFCNLLFSLNIRFLRCVHIVAFSCSLFRQVTI